MSWAIWVATAIFVLTVAGMLYMGRAPLRDAQGNVVDDIGRPVARLSDNANVVLITLRNSSEPLSGYELRRHVTMTRQDFYAMIADLEHKNLIANQVDQLGKHNIRRYLLTENGHALFDQNDAA